MIANNVPIWQLTVGEFVALMQQIQQSESKPDVKPDAGGDESHVYGIAGIAALLGCSKGQVHEYRRQGWIEPAIKQYGRKIVCDRRLALELFGKRMYKKR
ncbi:MAG: DUF3853 family protein [Tannerella sp.]|nr:DUF3853 family protein [Tannerella sp.]